MYGECFLVVLFMCLCQSRGQYFEGQSCSIDGGTGVCKVMFDCPAAIEAIKKRITPKICSFVGTDPVVCCIETATPSIPPPIMAMFTAPVVTTDKPSLQISTTEYVPAVYDYVDLEPTPQCAPLGNKTAPRTGQKAWDKCIEYQEAYVYPCERGPSGAPMRMNHCKHKTNQLIVGGTNAMDSEFPHMALLGFNLNETNNIITFACGGSVISDKFILTAGHCTYTQRKPVKYALLGTLQRSDDYDKRNLYKIQEIYKHPDYAPPVKYNDIALLETETRIRLYLKVIPACLDVGQQMAPEAWATGWGLTAYYGSQADTLQKVKLQRFSDEECVGTIRQYDRLMKDGIDIRTQMCYGHKFESKDTCKGDSGGPLQIGHDRISCMYIIIGVTSFGRKCGVVGEPGIYTRVSEYVPWIESVVWP